MQAVWETKAQTDGASKAAWYALKVRTRSEPVAAFALQNRGYTTLSPMFSERRRYSDRMKSVETALFPGYLFCHFNPFGKTPVLSSPAVEYIVRRSGAFVAIDDIEIESIRRMAAAGGGPSPYLAAGQRVRVEYGPLSGIDGIITRVDGECNLTLSMELLQRSITVRIQADQVHAL